MAEPARLRRIVVAQARQVAMEPVALEVDMAAMADRQEGIAHRRRQSRLGGDLVAGAHVGSW
ncbi:hypothetical protein [Mesorhizobium sp.]|uniref:hypothetical protein n=1 Tax=Mesorhizobium sp. TaxID=1871066 RepID=UPI00257DBE74|nr:hypothetical protein [Mesorhizobium sp.]